MFVTRKTYDAVVRERDEALALVAKLRATANRLIDDHGVTMRRKNVELAEQDRQIASRDQRISMMHAELSRAYVHDARGRIARHPLNTGGKVKA